MGVGDNNLISETRLPYKGYFIVKSEIQWKSQILPVVRKDDLLSGIQVHWWRFKPTGKTWNEHLKVSTYDFGARPTEMMIFALVSFLYQSLLSIYPSIYPSIFPAIFPAIFSINLSCSLSSNYVCIIQSNSLSGMAIPNVEPLPNSDSHQMRPLCTSTMSLHR